MIKLLSDYAAYMLDADLTGVVEKIVAQGYATVEDVFKLKDCIYFLKLQYDGKADTVSRHRMRLLKDMSYIANNI